VKHSPFLRIRPTILIVIAAWLVLAAGCAKSPVSGENAGSGPLIATFRSEPKSFNRLVAASAPENLLTLLTQATLVRVNRATGELEPRLASDWTKSADGLTWTVHLQKGLTFSDGAPFTSADVVFTFQALYDERVGSAMASSFTFVGKPLRVSAVDANTVQVVFPTPYGPGLSILDSLPILPRHKLSAALDAGTFLAAWNVKTPPGEVVGLGPFVLAEYTSGQRLRFTRNPHFWRRDAHGLALPYLDEVVVQIVPERNGEMLRLESGSADLTDDFARAEDMTALRQYVDQGQIRLADAGIDINPNHLWFNLKPGAVRAKDRPWLQKEEFRKAISYAIDRQKIVDTVYLGAAIPIYGPITPGNREWYVPTLPKTEHDLARARALLTSIGLVDRNHDGMLDDPGGRPLKFSILTQKGDTIRERTVAVIQQELAQVGLTVDVEPVERGAIPARSGSGDYDAIYFGVLSDAFDPARNLDYWMSSGSFHFWNPGQLKPATPWEAKIDDLMRQQASTLDSEARHRLFEEAQRTLADHMPSLYFAAPKQTVATSARLSGATPSVMSPPVLWNAEVLSLTAPLRR
jgi:peptide/nickel transport system substrate-binding protein